MPLENISYLINTILAEKELVVFLGAGSSQEGKQNGKAYPGFDKLIQNILLENGIEFDENNKWEKFQGLLKRWDQESVLSFRLSKYLYGTPGNAHIQLAILMMVIFPKVNMNRVYTTNYDDLMYKAFNEVAKNFENRDPRVFSFKKNEINRELENVFNAIDKHDKNGSPVVIKLFGDLTVNAPIFSQDEMDLEEPISGHLIDIFKKPMLFIGYSLSDYYILRLLVQTNKKSPTFIVSPKCNIPDFLLNVNKSNYYVIDKYFGDFVDNVITKISEIDPVFYKNYIKTLKNLDPSFIFSDIDSLSRRLRQVSNISLLRLKEKTVSCLFANKTKYLTPVTRYETSPNFNGFLQSGAKIMAIVGESGCGKSTLLYQVYNNLESNNYICLFYDILSIQNEGTLSKKLSIDLFCERSNLEFTLDRINNILKEEKTWLLITIDAINESPTIDPLLIRCDIEDLADRLPDRVKLCYSCRKVYWDVNLSKKIDLPKPLYYNQSIFILTKYDLSETKVAYSSYKTFFNLQSKFEDLSEDTIQNLRDPLMLRLVSESYSNKHLPSFAPAVLVFANSLNRIRLKYKHTPLIEFIESLIGYKLNAFKTNNQVNDIFDAREIKKKNEIHLLSLQQMANKRYPEDPLVLLEDEKLIIWIDEYNSYFKFSHERFYEFLLGIGLDKQLNRTDDKLLIRDKIGKLVNNFIHGHYSFIQGLKSALVRIYVTNENDQFRSEVIQTILHSDKKISNFGKEVVRELLFESSKDIVNELEQLQISIENKLNIILEIASDSVQVIDTAIKGLFSNSIELSRKSCYILINIVNSDELYKKSEDLLLKYIECTSFSINSVTKGSLYFLAFSIHFHSKDGEDGLAGMIKTLKKINKLKNSYSFFSVFSKELSQLINDEGIHFFGEYFNPDGIIYPWTSPSNDLLNNIPGILSILNSKKFKDFETQMETILFIVSLKKSLSSPDTEAPYAYQIEYRIVQWSLIRFSKNNFYDTEKLLNNIVYLGGYLAIDFALGVMEFILMNIHKDSPEIIRYGHKTMANWISYFESKFIEFYLSLEHDDPFNINFVPLVMLARIEAEFFTKPNGLIEILASYLSSDDNKKIKIGLLTARWLSKEYPKKIINCIELINDLSSYEGWIDIILNEICQTKPRLIEDFMDKHSFDNLRKQKIRFNIIKVEPSGVQHNGEAFYRSIFLHGDTRLFLVENWYNNIYNSNSIDDFCNKLVNALLDFINNRQ